MKKKKRGKKAPKGPYRVPDLQERVLRSPSRNDVPCSADPTVKFKDEYQKSRSQSEDENGEKIDPNFHGFKPCGEGGDVTPRGTPAPPPSSPDLMAAIRDLDLGYSGNESEIDKMSEKSTQSNSSAETVIQLPLNEEIRVTGKKRKMHFFLPHKLETF